MKTYKKTLKKIEVKQLSRCFCDRCGAEVDIAKNWESLDNNYADIDIRNRFISNDWRTSYLNYQLCPDCTIELLDFFKMANEDDKREIKEDILLWANEI